MQNDMLMTIHRSQPKPEIEFQYGGRPFSKTGSSYISALDWAISLKFGMQIDFHLLKQIHSLNLNPEVHFWLYGRHLEKSILRHNSAVDRPITMKFGRQMQNDMPMTTHRSKSKAEAEFQHGGRQFSKTGSSFISAVDWDISSKFGMQMHFHLLKQMLSLNLKPGVDLRLYGCHLKNSIWRHYSATDRPISTKFWKTDIKWHADDHTYVKIETGNRIPIRRPSVFLNRK